MAPTSEGVSGGWGSKIGAGLSGDEENRPQLYRGADFELLYKRIFRLTNRAATLDEICELFHRRRIRFFRNQIDSQDLSMGTAEWIALGLLLITLVGWYWWRGTPDGQAKQ